MKILTIKQEREYEDRIYQHVKQLYKDRPSAGNRSWLVARMDRLNTVDKKILESEYAKARI